MTYMWESIMSNDVGKAEMRSDLHSNGVGDQVDQSIADCEAVMESRLMAQPQGGGVWGLDDLKRLFHHCQSVMTKLWDQYER